jgi:hypothetical protein
MFFAHHYWGVFLVNYRFSMCLIAVLGSLVTKSGVWRWGVVLFFLAGYLLDASGVSAVVS